MCYLLVENFRLMYSNNCTFGWSTVPLLNALALWQIICQTVFHRLNISHRDNSRLGGSLSPRNRDIDLFNDIQDFETFLLLIISAQFPPETSLSLLEKSSSKSTIIVYRSSLLENVHFQFLFQSHFQTTRTYVIFSINRNPNKSSRNSASI